MTAAKHTPLGPFVMEPQIGTTKIARLVDDKGNPVVITALFSTRIAHAIMSHDELADALEMARDTLAAIRKHPSNPWKSQDGDGIRVEDICSAALAKAGRQP